MNCFEEAQLLFNDRYSETKAFLENAIKWKNWGNLSQADKGDKPESWGDFQISRQHEHVLKSNIILMQYNIIESAFLELYLSLYNYLSEYEIAIDQLDPALMHKVFCMIKDLSNNKRAEFKEKIHREEGRNFPFSSNILSICFKLDKEAEKKLINGNLDGRKIKEFFNDFGVDISNIDQMNLQCILTIKNKRQMLAHGAMSFSDVGKEIAWDNLESNLEVIKDLFEKSKESLSSFVGNLDIINRENSESSSQ